MHIRRSRLVSLIALATFVATFGLPFVDSRHAFGADVDLGWGEDRIGLGHPITQVEPVYPARVGDHCAFCHWARAFSGAVNSDIVRYLAPSATGGVVQFDFVSAATVSIVAGPPRGPPDSL